MRHNNAVQYSILMSHYICTISFLTYLSNSVRSVTLSILVETGVLVASEVISSSVLRRNVYVFSQTCTFVCTVGCALVHVRVYVHILRVL